MKRFSKCLILLLTAATLLTACTKAENGDATTTAEATTAPSVTDPGQEDAIDNRPLAEIYADFMGKVKSQLPSLMQQKVPADQYEYYIGIDKPDKTTETLVAEPMMGSIPFAITLLRVEGDTDTLNSIAKEIKSKVDPRRWICVSASYVETAVKGNVIILVMDNNNARGKEIVKAFSNG